jgi:hypothetical protein
MWLEHELRGSSSESLVPMFERDKATYNRVTQGLLYVLIQYFVAFPSVN